MCMHVYVACMTGMQTHTWALVRSCVECIREAGSERSGWGGQRRGGRSGLVGHMSISDS